MAFVVSLDSSGNENHFSPVNLAVSDVSLDTPQNNFAVLNPIEPAGATLTQGNLHKVSNDQAAGTFFFSSGKWYCEVALLSGSSSGSTFNYYIGVEDSVAGGARSAWTLNYVSLGLVNGGNSPDIFQVTMDSNLNGTVTQPTGSRPDAVAIIGVAIDVDDGDVEFYINGTLNGKCLGITNWTLPLSFNLAYWTSTVGAKAYVANFGQNGTFSGNAAAGGNADDNGIGNFKYSPPTGYLAMCTSNLPEPIVPSKHFNTVRWKGNGSLDHDISGVGFEPDLTWVKNRSNTNGYWAIHDDVRGAGYSFTTHTSSIPEYDYSDYFGPFQSDGFRVADVSSGPYFNTNNENFVAWNWKAGTAFSNDASATGIGTIDSSGQVNTDAGFSIVKFTGTGSNGTVKHGLDAAPEFIQVRQRAAHNWFVYNHKTAASPEDYIMYMSGGSGITDDATAWNDTAPTSSVFSVGTNDGINTNGTEAMAYCWRSIEGYSKFGSYESNGTTNDGPFVYTGFTPDMIMIIYLDGTGEWWWVQDWERNSYNASNYALYFNSTSVEGAAGTIDFLSNGFKFRSTNGGINNANTYLYMAWADFPFKYANAR